MTKLYTIKPPEWRLCGLWWIADTIVGQLAVHDLIHNWDAPNSVGSADSVEDGKALATTHYEKAMAAGLVENVCEWTLRDHCWDTSCGATVGTELYCAEDSYCHECGGRITEADDAKD